MASSTTQPLGNNTEWELLVNDRRVLARSKSTTPKENSGWNWTVLSSAVLLGGLEKVSPENSSLRILNTKVPLDYDGINPDPVEFLQRLAKEEESKEGNSSPSAVTVGLMTAASMKSLRVATQRALDHNQLKQLQKQDPTTSDLPEVIVDAIVTAGISNSRCAGATADYFFFSSGVSQEQDESKKLNSNKSIKHGTINTIIVTNAVLPESQLITAYAVAVEAKCRATADLGIVCGKDVDSLAQGTGTDSTVLVTKGSVGDKAQGTVTAPNSPLVDVGGKHTLFGEMVGKAVYEATQDAILANLEHVYGTYAWLSPTMLYRLRCYKLQLLQALKQGNRPWIPSTPMKPIPRPTGTVLMVGLMGVLLAFGVHFKYHEDVVSNYASLYELITNLPLPRPSATILLAVFIWDRFLDNHIIIPISLHPVVLVGKLITAIVSIIPDSFFHRPLLGFGSGCFLLLATLMGSLVSAWCLLTAPHLFSHFLLKSGYFRGTFSLLATFLAWFTKLYIVKSSVNLQLLCTVSLQLAHFLERGQIQQARGQMGWLVSRDPSNLRPDELAGATLESLSENLSDSLVSPLFWYVLLGPLGALGFKVVNTLDSRVGYRGRYEWVGKPSARFDDLMNLLSARFTAVLLVVSAYVVSYASGGSSNDNQTVGKSVSANRGWKVARRDSSQCDSPNAGWPMGAMAGILNVCLEKRGQYALNPVRDGGNAPGYLDIRLGHDIAQLAGMGAMLLALIASAMIK